MIGLTSLLDCIIKYMPAIDDEAANIGFRVADGYEAFEAKEDAPFSAVVFKTLADPFLGKISIFKVLSGSISKDDKLYNASKDRDEKIASLFYLRGNEQIKTDKVVAGDIGAFAKLEATSTGDTLCSKENKILYKQVKYPKPVLFYAIKAVSRADEDKISEALQKLAEEDPSFNNEMNRETSQQVLSGLGNVQLEVIMDKLKDNYSVNTEIVEYRIPYRETIKGKSDVQGKHKNNPVVQANMVMYLSDLNQQKKTSSLMKKYSVEQFLKLLPSCRKRPRGISTRRPISRL